MPRPTTYIIIKIIKVQKFSATSSKIISFFEATTDILPTPNFAQSFQLTLGELFGWLLE